MIEIANSMPIIEGIFAVNLNIREFIYMVWPSEKHLQIQLLTMFFKSTN